MIGFQDNEEENRRISAMREARLLEEGERRKEEIAEKIHQHDVREAERLERVEELVDREKAESLIETVIKTGYRHIDGACDYGNEKEVRQFVW